MKHFCTYFDRNYLVKGLALIRSLKIYHGNDFKLYIVCMDEITRAIVGELKDPSLITIGMHEIEHGDERLLACKKNRSDVEYLWTTTPTIILRVIEKFPEIDILTYLDADLFFYSSSNPIYEELGAKAVLIHPHRFPAHLKEQEQHGIYNVGLLCFRNNREGLEVLNWWRDRCIEWCYSRVEDGKFGDQGYLNDWPTRFPCVKVSQNIGVGVAPWNDDQYAFSVNEAGQAFIDKTPIVFYHYHSFTCINPSLYIPARDPTYVHSFEIAKTCVLPYAYAIFESAGIITSIHPDYDFGLIKTDFGLTALHAFIARKELAPEIQKISLPQKPRELDSNWIWYQP